MFSKVDELKEMRPKDALNTIKSLELRQKDESILIMRYVYNMSYSEMASEMHVEVQTIGNLVTRARKQYNKYR